MRTVDECHIAAPVEAVFSAACEVAAWPRLLSHYRKVTVKPHEADGSAEVEMAAWRPFGLGRWPVWWVAEMRIDDPAKTVTYRHIRGITTGMDVVWRVVAGEHGTDVSIEHTWRGPGWPLIGRVAADMVIGPVFIHGIASRTLAGLAAVLETQVRHGEIAVRQR